MQITIGNSVIPLSPGTNLPLVLRSPLFLTDDGKIPGSYIFNFPVPAGEAIRQVFAQAHRVQKGSYTTTDLPYVITNGSVRYAGSCIVTQASNDKYEIACKVDNGDFAGIIAGKTLKDLDLGGDKTIVDVFSDAFLASGFMFDRQQQGEWTYPITLIDTISNDFTTSLSSNGNIFTCTGSFSIKLTSFIHITVAEGSQLYGYIIMSILKNGTQIITHNINTVGLDICNNQISVVAGDTIETRFVVHSSILGPASFFVVSSRVLYQTENAFTTLVNALGDQYDNDFTIFPIHNQEQLAEFPDDAFCLDNVSIKTLYSAYFKVLNYYSGGEFPILMTGSSDGEYFAAANLFTPFVYMRTLLLAIASEAGYTIVNNPFDTDDFKNMVLFNAYAENTYTSRGLSLVYVKRTFNLIDHVPTILQSDFIKAISLLTGYMPMVDNNLQIISFVDLKRIHLVSNTNVPVKFPGILLETPIITIEPEYKGIKLELTKAGNDQYLDHIKELNEKLIYKGQVDHLSELPASGNLVNDMYLVLESNEYYVYQYNPETYTLTWWFFSKNFPIIYTEGVEPFFELTIDLCPILTTHFRDETLGCPENRYWILPKTEQAGILEGFPDSLATECGFQVLYYKGMVHDSLGEDYPLGSSRRADFSEIETYPDLSARSIFENRYMYFLRWLAYKTKLVTFKAILSPSQLNSLSFSQLYAASDTFFLLKEIRINLELDGFSLAEIDMYVC